MANKPKIRFKGFDDAWEQRKFGDVGSVAMCKRVFKEQTFEIGEIPFYKIGTFGGEPDAFISKDLFNEYKSKYSYPNKGDILISASGSIGRIVEFTGKNEYFQDSNIVWLEHGNEIDNRFLKVLYSVVEWPCEGSTIKRLYNDNFLKTKFMLPKIEEQIKIGEYFQLLDHLITLHQRKYLQEKKTSLTWEQRKLEDMCSIITKQTGFDYSATIKPSLVTSKGTGTYSFIQNKDFEGMNINLNTDFYIPISVADKYPKITLDRPSLLISISGRIGNVGLYLLDSKAFIGGAVGICKLNDIEDGKTVLYELLAPTGQRYFNSLIKASSHANITVEDIRQIEVLLPKNKDEKVKLNRYFENLDHLITLHQRKYLQEKKTSLTWEQRKLSELASMHARIGWQNLRTSEFLDVGDYMLITGTDFEDGKVNYSTCHYVEKERYDQDKNIQIKNGSILITKDGTLGKVAYVEGLSMPATLNAGVFNVEIKNKNETDGRYLFQFLKAPFLMDYVAQKATGGTIKHLNQNILVDFPISSPSKEEQTKIGECFSSIDHLITLHRRAHFHRRRRTYK